VGHEPARRAAPGLVSRRAERPRSLLGIVAIGIVATGCGRVDYRGDADASADGTASDAASADDGATATMDAGSRCGDGRFASVIEQCDDSNVLDGDGCSSTCQLESQGPGGGSCSDVLIIQLVPVGVGRLGALAGGNSVGSASDLIASCGGGGPEHVYGVVLDRPGELFVHVENLSATDVVLHVRGGDGAVCLDAAAELGCADGGAASMSETLSLPALPAGGYFVVADGNGETGDYRINFLFTAS
jgi:cysteine-rich repeat protein